MDEKNSSGQRPSSTAGQRGYGGGRAKEDEARGRGPVVVLGDIIEYVKKEIVDRIKKLLRISGLIIIFLPKKILYQK